MDFDVDGVLELEVGSDNRSDDEGSPKDVVKPSSRFEDGVAVVVGELDSAGYEFDCIMIRDLGATVGNCGYCNTPIRYEHKIVFVSADNSQKYIIVGSTCVEYFQEYIGAFDMYRARKDYKIYRSLMVEIHGYDDVADIPPVKYSELGDVISDLRKKAHMVRARSSYPDIFDFISGHHEDDPFYANLWDRLINGLRISDRQCEVVRNQIKRKSSDFTGVDDYDEKLCDAWVIRSLLDFAERGVFKLDKSGRSDKEFVLSLYNGFVKYRSWTENQYYWIGQLINRYRDDLVSLAKMKPGDYECPECDSASAVLFSDRGFSICPSGHIVRYPELVKNNLEMKEDWEKKKDEREVVGW